MAISWLTVLQAVPWTEVIRNAPKVADGAKKLWSSVAGRPAQSAVGGGAMAQSRGDSSREGLQARVDSLESTVTELHDQLLSSAELIKQLADQNTLLVQRVEANRVRSVRMGWALAIVAVIAVAGVVW
ncbi:MAG: hypothetical protein K2W80_15755 [Burkholderiales bacterium]|nr:hypothetical protein [Burkholderiales bacterium]